MQLMPLFVTVIFVSMAMLVLAMYLGGGQAAVRNQAGPLVMVAASITAIALLIVFVSNTGGPLVMIGIFASSTSAVIAALLGRSMRMRSGTLGTLLWILAAVFGALTIVGIATVVA